MAEDKGFKVVEQKFAEHSLAELKFLRRVETQLVEDGNFEYRGGPLVEPIHFVGLCHKITKSDREIGVVIFLDSRYMPIGFDLWPGGIDFVAMDPRQIFKEMALLNATKVVILHNHPEGIAQPSNGDRAFCMQMTNLCNIMGWILHDFIVLAKTEFYSFRAQRDQALVLSNPQGYTIIQE